MSKSEADSLKAKTQKTSLEQAEMLPAKLHDQGQGLLHTPLAKDPSGSCLLIHVPRRHCIHLGDRLPFSNLHKGTTLVSFSLPGVHLLSF